MHHDPLDVESQEKSRESIETLRALAVDAEASDFKWLMERPQGRRIIWRLLDWAGVFRSSFHTTAMQMAFNEGNRNYGTRILDLVHTHTPDLYAPMMKENTDGKDIRRNNSTKR